jgi:hypothetical protein
MTARKRLNKNGEKQKFRKKMAGGMERRGMEEDKKREY